ncbi:hypothetical protein GPJ56_005816 [Histomonas meleagridis]|uniref:uncharacterized protein n=1 Tax=Histomonas meleagridis TaxID=135588 RepID=UPI00355968AA|nr:hypothetical protein GPJ56_005816 [Histomonas meleagridis]KAH0798648.1 hypothetical protein GO595_008513 [Histomonas meleagridis]
MSRIIKQLLEAENQTNEQQECWVIIAGNHGVGKSHLIETFFKSISNNTHIQPAKSTFGYEYTVLQYNEITVNIFEFTEIDLEHCEIISSLIQDHASKLCILLLFDINHLDVIDATINNLLIPMYSFLAGLDSSIQDSFAKYLQTLFTDEPISIPSLSNNSGVPFFFVGTNPEVLDDFDDIQFDGIISHLRKSALEYTAGVALSNSNSLLSAVVSCATRTPLDKELRTKFCDRSDYFFPPGWDSSEKLADIESSQLPKEKQEEATSKTVTIQNWQSFLETLSKSGPRESRHPEIAKKEENEEVDFLAQFED